TVLGVGSSSPGVGTRAVSVLHFLLSCCLLSHCLSSRGGLRAEERGRGGGALGTGCPSPAHAVAALLPLDPLHRAGEALLLVAVAAELLAIVQRGAASAGDGSDVVGLADHRI